jgi:hypothetical protein
MTESESQELDGLKHRVVMAMGRQIADIMENGRKEEHPTAADLAVALKWLHDEKSDGETSGNDNPVAAAIEQIRAARRVGGKVPVLHGETLPE